MESRKHAIDEKLLDDKLYQLESAREWSPRVISKLEQLIRADDEFDVFRVDPLQAAPELRIDEQEAIDLFLHAANLGIFQMHWQVVCPRCADVVEDFETLKKLHRHFVCLTCGKESHANLDDYIQVTFTVSPSLRSIRYHTPDSLEARDYFRSRRAKNVLSASGYPTDELLINASSIFQYVEPGARVEKEVEVEPDTLYVLANDFLHEGSGSVWLEVDQQSTSKSDGSQHINVILEDEQIKPNVEKLAPGNTSVTIENRNSTRALPSITTINMDFMNEMDPTFPPMLTGKQLINSQTFRYLFRAETIAGDEGIGVKSVALLFTDLVGSTALYERVGDLNAFSLIQRHFDYLSKVIQEHGGAVVKTIGDAVMAAFNTSADAARAALAMHNQIDDFNRGQSNEELVLKVGIHNGPSVAVTLNDRLDYFGQTVNIAARIQKLSGGGDLYVSKDVFDAEGVQDALASCRCEEERAELHGISNEVPVYRVDLTS